MNRLEAIKLSAERRAQQQAAQAPARAPTEKGMPCGLSTCRKMVRGGALYCSIVCRRAGLGARQVAVFAATRHQRAADARRVPPSKPKTTEELRAELAALKGNDHFTRKMRASIERQLEQREAALKLALATKEESNGTEAEPVRAGDDGLGRDLRRSDEPQPSAGPGPAGGRDSDGEAALPRGSGGDQGRQGEPVGILPAPDDASLPGLDGDVDGTVPDGDARTQVQPRRTSRRVIPPEPATPEDFGRLAALFGDEARELALVLRAPPCQARLDVAKRVCEAAGKDGAALVSRLSGTPKRTVGYWREKGWRYKTDEEMSAIQRSNALRKYSGARAPPRTAA